MVRGHDHVEERYAIYPAYQAHPVLTTVALSRRLSRERFGPYERAPTLAQGRRRRCFRRCIRLHIPPDIIRDVYPEADLSAGFESEAMQRNRTDERCCPALPELRDHEGRAWRVRGLP